MKDISGNAMALRNGFKEVEDFVLRRLRTCYEGY